MEQTIKCPICGKPYKIFSHYAGDQSACPSCVKEAEREIKREPFTWMEIKEISNGNEKKKK
jgi:endogenous inhibitor of DNA gyrase (YacG/DUF329 family)